MISRPLALLCLLCLNCFVSNLATAQDLGQAPINGNPPATQTVSLTFNGATAAPALSLAYGLEYQLGKPSCTGTGPVTCAVVVTFTPKYPGLRQDAIFAKDSAGKLVSTTFLHGIGLGPEVVVQPGTFSIEAGTGMRGYTGDGGPATNATFSYPASIAVDMLGNLFIADSQANVVRRIDAGTAVITTVAGLSSQGYGGDGGAAASAMLNQPSCVALDGAGNLYIGDTGNNVVRKVDAVTKVISTIAGNAAKGVSGDGGRATNAAFNNISGLVVDADGNIFISDSNAHVIREVDASQGIINTVAGTGVMGASGDGGAATRAQLNGPVGLALDSSSNLYIADTYNSRVRQINKVTGIITTVLGLGAPSPAAQVPIGFVTGITIDAAGGLYAVAFPSPLITELYAGTGVAQIIGRTDQMRSYTALCIDSLGTLYAVGQFDYQIDKYSAGGSISFAQTPINQVSTPQTVFVGNIGNQALTLSSVSVSANFIQAAPGGTACSANQIVPAGADCPLSVSFTPSVGGRLSGIVTLTDNALNQVGAQQQISLIGGPSITYSPAGLSFGNESLGLTAAPQVITLTNNSSAPIQITGISISGTNSSEFVETNTCSPNVSYNGATLAGGATCSINVKFTPLAAGSRTASLTFTDSVDPAPQSIVLSGTGGGSTGACFATTFMATPNPIITTAPLGVATLASNANCSYDIRVNGPAGPLFASGTGASSYSTREWVSNGMVFYLQASGDTSAQGTLATVTVLVSASGNYSADLGQLSIQSPTPNSLAVSLEFPALTSPPTFSLRYGREFSLSSATCAGTSPITCAVPVNFTPAHPGLRQDALLARDNTGKVILETFLHGIGIGPQSSITPGVISTIAQGGQPTGLTVDTNGNVYFADVSAGVVSEVDGVTGATTVLTGPSNSNFLLSPEQVAVDAAGNIYVANFQSNLISRIDAITGVATTPVGQSTFSGSYSGDGGPATNALLFGPAGIAIDTEGDLYISEANSKVIRRVSAVTGIISTIAGTPSSSTCSSSGDGGPATNASFCRPDFILVDPNRNVYVADLGNSSVRRIDAITGVISTVAGNSIPGYSGDGGPATSAQLNGPRGLAMDAGGNLYISDQQNTFIRKVDAASGTITTIAGTRGYNGAGPFLYSGDGGAATLAELSGPAGIALDSSGNLYFADQYNSAIRKITASPAPLTFLQNALGVPSASKSLTVSNTGNANLNVSSLAVAGPNAANFGLSNGCAGQLAPGSSCDLGVTFTADGVGTRNASMSITTDSSQTIALTGNTAVAACQVLAFSATVTPTASFLTTATLNVNATCTYDIRVGSPAGPLFSSNIGQSSNVTGQWVTDGMLFYLQQAGNTTSQGTLSSLTVPVGPQACVVTAFAASPNPLQQYPGATITAIDNCPYDIRVGAPNGALFGSAIGETDTYAPWAVSGLTFYLQQAGNTTPQGTLAFFALTSNPQPCSVQTFAARPSPIFAASGYGMTSLNVQASCTVDIRVGGPAGPLFATEPANYTVMATTGPWVTDGMTFYLQTAGDTTPFGTLSTLTVNVKP